MNLQLPDSLHYPLALAILYSPHFSLSSVSNLYSVLWSENKVNGSAPLSPLLSVLPLRPAAAFPSPPPSLLFPSKLDFQLKHLVLCWFQLPEPPSTAALKHSGDPVESRLVCTSLGSFSPLPLHQSSLSSTSLYRLASSTQLSSTSSIPSLFLTECAFTFRTQTDFSTHAPL